MRTWGLLLIGLGALQSIACTGGQSGTEGQPDMPACGDPKSRSAGIDEQTPAGTARTLFASVASAPQAANLRWYPPDGVSSPVDTTLTLSLGGAPTAATYYSDSNPTCPTLLRVDGGVLLFQTADGTFNESVPGSVTSSTAPESKLEFDGYPAPDFAGTYDVAAATAHFASPRIWLETSFTPATGFLVVGEASSTNSLEIATWTGTPSGGGSDPGGGGGSAGSADAGGSAASGG